MNVTVNISELLQEFDLAAFLAKNKHLNGAQYLLQSKGNTNALNLVLADQLNLYPKAIFKIPSFTQAHCVLSPKSYEQCSSEMSANFKRKLYRGKSLLDLSGGLGVDDWALSPVFETVISLDPNATLNELVRYNFKRLGVQNIERIDTSAELFLEKENGLFDLIYLDADRRMSKERDFSLEGGNPSYPLLQEKLLRVGKKIVLKLSPMADLLYLQKELKGLHTIRVIGLEAEVKEIIAEIIPDYKGPVSIVAHLLPEDIHFPGTFAVEMVQEGNTFFVETHKVLVKARLQKAYLQHRGIKGVCPSNTFGICKQEPLNFIGRTFRLVNTLPFSKSDFKRYLKENQIGKANLNRRDFPSTVEELRKQFGIKEGGKDYFFFCADNGGQLWVYHCLKLS